MAVAVSGSLRRVRDGDKSVSTGGSQLVLGKSIYLTLIAPQCIYLTLFSSNNNNDNNSNSQARRGRERQQAHRELLPPGGVRPHGLPGPRLYRCVYMHICMYIYIYIYEKGSLWRPLFWHILCWKSVFRLSETLHFKKHVVLLRGNTTFQNKRSA